MDESDLNAVPSGSPKPKKTTRRASPRVAGEAAAKKKPRVSRSRAAKSSGEADPASAPEPTLFESAPAPEANVQVVTEPVREERAPSLPPVSYESVAPERPVFVPSSEKPPVNDGAGDFSVSGVVAGGSAPDPVAPTPPPSLNEAPAVDPSSAQPGGAQHGGGGHDDDRGPWWKRKKDKKNRWKEKHQNGGGHSGGPGGGHGGGRHGGPQHPPQPPPPVLAPKHYGDLPDPARFADLAALDTLAAALQAGNGDAPIQVDQIYALNLFDLTGLARRLGMVFDVTPNRLQALEAIFVHAAQKQIPLLERGLVDLTDNGYGFVVHEQANYRLYPESTYLPEALIKRYALKRGHHVEVVVQSPQPGDRCPAVVGVKAVMGKTPEEVSKLTPFEELVPYYPLQRILLEAPEIHKDVSMRAVDLLTPIGFGQRGLLVAPPRTGKTVLLQNIANSISHNFPEKKLILLLIDERPEEVTDFKRHTKGEVVSSTFDEAPESHVHAAEMVIEKARRLVEQGEHVVILLDSITRLARAYNALAANSGKIMSGGVEATALQKPKRFFGSARNIEGGGSITIIGTALIDTGSRMDEVIFEEFKGTGNMELHLDRGLSDKRIFPAINIDRSGTRKEELIYHPEEMLRVYGLRRAMQGIPPVEAMDMFIQRLKKTKTNAEFLLSLNR